mmetsp:Transcript_19660/g.29223  ORF Transcript_19660/g.29223 Transcript_19660/m.29223 type:complete len:81 (-) Transcript_19660:406-648(-)
MVAQIEDILEDHNISMGQYHGRDMEGPATTRLMENAEDIFIKTKQLLLNNCKSGISREEIREVCENYKDLFLLHETVASP